MHTLTENGLYDLLSSLKGNTIVHLTTITAVRMRKTGNPLIANVVTKRTEQTCQFGYSYENAVNNRLEKQGNERTFVASSLVWGEWVKGLENKILTYKGKTYGRFYSLNSNNRTEKIYMVDGVIATPEQYKTIKEFEQGGGSSAKQASEGLTENQVKPMNYAFDSIVGIKVNGVEYEVVHEAETENA